MKYAQDFIGNEIKVGDYVLASGSRSTELQVMIVTQLLKDEAQSVKALSFEELEDTSFKGCAQYTFDRAKENGYCLETWRKDYEYKMNFKHIVKVDNLKPELQIKYTELKKKFALKFT